jgi:3-isopropylmalate dehydratase
MLPINITDQPTLEKIAQEAREGKEIEIDLPTQEIRDASGTKLASFDVEEFRKHCLVNGLDDIGLTLQVENKIKKYEDRMAVEMPWIGDSGYLRRGRQGPVKVTAVPVPKTNRGEEKKEPLEW